MLDNQSLSLKQRSIGDIIVRARLGVIVYILLWVMMARWSGIYVNDPQFFYINLSLLSILFILRITHYIVFIINPYKNIIFMGKALVFLVLFSALQWGLSISWIFSSDKYNDYIHAYALATVAIAFGGTFTFSIVKEIRYFYPIIIMLPPSVALWFIGGEMNKSLAVLSFCAVLYLFESSRVSSNDYWQSIKSQALAEKRALLMEELSNLDPLTTLYNRQFFNTKLVDEWNRCHRQQISLSVMMIDLDHFKVINDTYGHVFGDQCLRLVSSTLKNELPRETDTVARYGGEEFIVLLPNTNEGRAEVIAQKLISAISLILLSHEDTQVSISCSIGLACLIPNQDQNKQSIIVAADLALYKAKNNGRNQYQIANNIVS